MDIFAMAKENFDETVALRRHFHMYPEAGPEEQLETMAYVEQQLDLMDIRHLRVPGGGIFAFIDGPAEGKTVLLRTDLDGLPIEESPTNLAGPKVCVSKKPGLMHGCGHDGHIAMLLTEAKILKQLQSQLPGSIILMFEEGEEGHRNGEKLLLPMQKEGYRVDTCYSTHVRWDVPVGKVACCPGTAMSGLYHFTLELRGLSGHSSRPDLAHSTIDCFHEIYTALETLRLRYVRPDTALTWAIGSVNAGERFNVVPDHLVCQGGVRYLDRASGMAFWKEFKRVLDVLCPLNYCTYTLVLEEGLLPVINNEACRRTFLDSTEKYLGKDAIYSCDPWMASESFSYPINMYPGVLSFTGIQNVALGSGANHHTPEFDLDEDGLVYGVTAAVGYALEFLKNPPDTSAFQPICPDMETLISMLHNA